VDSNGTFLAFLTRKPPDYQDAASGEVGEVVYVEYLVQSNALKRRMIGGSETYRSMLTGATPSNNTTVSFQVLATNIIAAETAMRRTMVVREAEDLAAVSRSFVPVSRGWICGDTNVVTFADRPDLAVGQVYQTNGGRWYRIIGRTNTSITNADSGAVLSRIDALANLLINTQVFTETPEGDLPQAIEVNLPATDMGTMANMDLYNQNTNMVIRNPGFFHFRATLFPSP
jgi:hypothetical protein